MGVDKTKLGSDLVKVVGAIEELAKVLTGGAYNSDTLWNYDSAQEGEAATYLTGLTISAGLKKNLTTVLEKVPGLQGAMQSASDALKNFITNAAKQVSSVTGGVVDSLNRLNTPHDPSTYPVADTANFGFIQAFLGIGTAASVPGMDGVQKSIDQALNLAADATAGARFLTLATGTLTLLTNAMAK